MFVCMFYAPMPISMPSHACMLEFAFSHTFMFIFTCLDVYPHAYRRISMLICVDWCVSMLRSMFSICFMPSSMCLCAAMFMCLGLGLVCHVMCYCSPFVHFIAFSCVLA